MSNDLIIFGSIAFITSLLFAPLLRAVAIRYSLFDSVSSDRKVHAGLIPRVGGIGIYLAFVIPMLLILDLGAPLVALFLASVVVFAIGLIDDIRGLNPYTKLIGQVFAALIVLTGGIGIVNINLPWLAEPVTLDQWRIPIEIASNQYNIIPIANAVTVAWIVVIINAVNLLDGLDGLAGGVSSIALITLLILASQGFGSLTVVIIAILMLMSVLGFLANNFYPANIFMGDSGAYVIGLFLAVLPIYAATKTTVGVLVIGIAIVDLVWAVVRRLIKKKSPFSADRGHIHHRLLDSGIRHINVVLIFYLVAIATSLLMLSKDALFAVGFLGLSILGLLWHAKKKTVVHK